MDLIIEFLAKNRYQAKAKKQTKCVELLLDSSCLKTADCIEDLLESLTCCASILPRLMNY